MTDNLVMTGATADEIWPLVRDYHYSGRQSSKVQHSFALRWAGGLFGDTGEPVAGITYSHPINRNFNNDALELSRLVRHPDCVFPLSAFVSWSLRWLRANTTKPYVVSYADTAHGHHGGIYQACGFVYAYESPGGGKTGFELPDGSFFHARSCNSRYGTNANAAILDKHPDWEPVYGEPKHLYIFPLRQKWATIARKHGWQRLPYPKPHAARLLDEQAPTCASEARTLGAAPDLFGAAA